MAMPADDRDHQSASTDMAPTVAVCLDDGLRAALEAYRRSVGTASGIDSDIRRILRRWLAENGYLARSTDEGMKPDALDASNDG